jgi:hypothetical protein
MLREKLSRSWWDEIRRTNQQRNERLASVRKRSETGIKADGPMLGGASIFWCIPFVLLGFSGGFRIRTRSCSIPGNAPCSTAAAPGAKTKICNQCDRVRWTPFRISEGDTLGQNIRYRCPATVAVTRLILSEAGLSTEVES